MAYTLPLRFIKVSERRSDNRQFDVSVCATRIVCMMSTKIYQARKTISDERKNGTLINAAGLSKAKTAIFLDNGSVVASPLTVRRLMTAVEKSEEQGLGRKTRKIKAYETEEPDELLEDEDVDDVDDDIDVEDADEDEEDREDDCEIDDGFSEYDDFDDDLDE